MGNKTWFLGPLWFRCGPRFILVIYLATVLVCQGCGGTRTNTRFEIPDPVQAEFWEGPKSESPSVKDWLNEHPVMKYGGIGCLIGGAAVGVAVILTPLIVFATAKRL